MKMHAPQRHGDTEVQRKIIGDLEKLLSHRHPGVGRGSSRYFKRRMDSGLRRNDGIWGLFEVPGRKRKLAKISTEQIIYSTLSLYSNFSAI